MGQVRRSVVVLLMGATATLTSCGERATEPAAEPGMCPDSIQFEGQQYTAWEATTPGSTAPTGTAVRGDCADVEPARVSFSSTGKTVQVGTFRRLNPDEVLGAEGADGEFYVYVSTDVSEARAEKLVARLTKHGQHR